MPDDAMAGSRACGLLLIASLLCCGLAAAAEQPSAAQMMDDLMYGRGPIGGPFTLTDQTGKQRSDTDFRGKLMIVYFGYTYCPDVCPTDLMAITQALDALGAAADGVQPIFITIDPERDTNLLTEFRTGFGKPSWHHVVKALQSEEPEKNLASLRKPEPLLGPLAIHVRSYIDLQQSRPIVARVIGTRVGKQVIGARIENGGFIGGFVLASSSVPYE
jgi:cytochrome oxidase Cu insertion factor (SCO1/SenC/PrrC family)